MTSEAYEKLSDYHKSVIRTWENELYLIDRGVRSVCTDFLHYDKDDGAVAELVYELEQMAVRRNLYFTMFDTVDKEDGKIDLSIYAYKYMHQLPLIKYVENGEKGYLGEWILGKLLGYSDESMDEYLCRDLVDCFEINNAAYKKKDVPSKSVSRSDESSKVMEWKTLFSSFVRNLEQIDKHLIQQPNLYTGPNFILTDYNHDKYIFSKIEGFDDIYSINLIFDNPKDSKLVGFTRISNDEYKNLEHQYRLSGALC